MNHTTEIKAALRSRVVKSVREEPTAFVVVICGSAFKNKGVQPLLDAVVDYLPSPVEIPSITVIDANSASMLTSFGARIGTPLVFVIVHDRSSGWPYAIRSDAAVTVNDISEEAKSWRSAACGAPVGNQLANGHPPGRMTGSGM